MSNTIEPALAIPHNWQNLSFVNRRPEQVDLARAALEKNRLNVPIPPGTDSISFAMPAMLAAQLSTFDSISGLEMQYNETVYQTLSSVLQSAPGYMNGVVSESVPSNLSVSFTPTLSRLIAYGYAAMRANRAYGVPAYLQMAQAAWETAFNYTITLQQATTGNVGDIKNSTLKLANECNSASLVGGTYALTDANSLFINAISSGAFLVLSGLLANATGNPMYLNAATGSFQFIHDQFYSPITNSPIDGINADTCATNPYSPTVILDSADFIEGTAILASVTGNDTLRNFTGILIQAALTNVAWQNPQGVLTNGHTTAVGDLGHLMRALSTAYELQPNDTALQAYVRAFTAVQYNSLLELAAEGDVYSGTWYGPSQGFSYDYGNQSAAADLLLSGILVNPISSVTSASTTGSIIPLPTGSATTDGKHRSDIGSIAGGVVGGLVVLLMIIALIALIIRQRRRRATMISMAPNEPFVATSHDSPPSVTSQGEYTRLKQSVATESPSFSTTFTTVEEGRQRTTASSLIWELNELLRRGSRPMHDDAGPPAYTAA